MRACTVVSQSLYSSIAAEFVISGDQFVTTESIDTAEIDTLRLALIVTVRSMSRTLFSRGGRLLCGAAVGGFLVPCWITVGVIDDKGGPRVFLRPRK